MIPAYQPYIARNQKVYVVDCVDNNKYSSTMGDYIVKFERELEKYFDIGNAIAVTNGTVSLQLILYALGIGAGDSVIVPSLTYAATVATIIHAGAQPILADSNPATYQMLDDYDYLSSICKPNTKALMVPQLYGNAPNMEHLERWCREHNIKLIEDSAEAFGCIYKPWNKKLGTLSTASSFSTFSNKNITTGGEGGFILTNDEDLAGKMRLARQHNHIGGFIHQGPGFNYRMCNINAAIGCAQLEEVDVIHVEKKRLAKYYRDHLHSDIYRFESSAVESTEWMPLFRLPQRFLYKDFYEHMHRAGIDIRPGFTPIHLMPGWNVNPPHVLGGAEKAHHRTFNLPSYPDLTEDQLAYIVKHVNAFLE